MLAVFGISGGEILLLFPFMGLMFLAFLFWVWMLVDAVQNTHLDQNQKLMWVLVIALTHFIGALIYFFAGRPRGVTNVI